MVYKKQSEDPYIQAFKERKKVSEWLKDIRCLINKKEILLFRLRNGINAEMAITTPVTENEIEHNPYCDKSDIFKFKEFYWDKLENYQIGDLISCKEIKGRLIRKNKYNILIRKIGDGAKHEIKAPGQIDNETKHKILEDRRKGLTLKELSKKYEVSQSRLNHVLYDNKKRKKQDEIGDEIGILIPEEKITVLNKKNNEINSKLFNLLDMAMRVEVLYNRDPLIMANNCIDRMREYINKAITLLEESE